MTIQIVGPICIFTKQHSIIAYDQVMLRKSTFIAKN